VEVTDQQRPAGPSTRDCPVCSQRLDGDSSCRNSLCRDPNRRIERIDAITSHSGVMQDKIHGYKYDGQAGWSLIFGRLLLRWIVANPTYLDPGQPGPGHIEAIIRAAARTDSGGRWPFDVRVPAAIIKTEATGQSAGRSFAEKRIVAAALREVLKIPDPARTAGRRILVFDDVCTTGRQLQAVADCLVQEGRAAGVRALVLARAPWR
jgi:predicted amidophosphoribosyltransferase